MPGLEQAHRAKPASLEHKQAAIWLSQCLFTVWEAFQVLSLPQLVFAELTHFSCPFQTAQFFFKYKVKGLQGGKCE